VGDEEREGRGGMEDWRLKLRAVADGGITLFGEGFVGFNEGLMRGRQRQSAV